jgi:beta-xylosidase
MSPPAVPALAQGALQYRNPVVFADYSDPDAIRAGEEFVMVASSFHCVPGLPVLRSRDLVHWGILTYALPRCLPLPGYDRPQHGCGVWAPSIRFHAGKYWIFYGDPDYGIFRVRADAPEGPWEEPLLIAPGRGRIDPCPFWDDDGRAYLVHAWAKSRVGYNSVLTLYRMDEQGTELLDGGTRVFDGATEHPTIEGPKLYKRGGFYYIFAPAGGVKTGWQTVLRSRSLYGPYEARVVLRQGGTPVNGPHQGAWVETPGGASWFLHFQDREAFGRVVHLQPMSWRDGWPVIGVDADGDGTGEPVLRYAAPLPTADAPPFILPASDEFEGGRLGLQWQWHANPRPAWWEQEQGALRLNAVPLPDDHENFWDVPNLLLQKFPGPSFTATALVKLVAGEGETSAGLIVMGTDYARLSLRGVNARTAISFVSCQGADRGGPERESPAIPFGADSAYLRVSVSPSGLCSFAWSEDGASFTAIGPPFQAKPGKWIGAKVGLYCVADGRRETPAYARWDWFRILPGEVL